MKSSAEKNIKAEAKHSPVSKRNARGASAGRLARNNVTCPVVTRNNNSPGTPSSYLFSTETVTDSSVLVWDRPTIRGFVERDPRLLENALLTASDYVAWHLASHIGLACHTVRQRVAQVLVTLARTIGQETPGGVELQITNEELANAANITPFTASRLMSKWQLDRALVKRRGQGSAPIA
jgi:CRP-like cAMP-binding protein